VALKISRFIGHFPIKFVEHQLAKAVARRYFNSASKSRANRGNALLSQVFGPRLFGKLSNVSNSVNFTDGSATCLCRPAILMTLKFQKVVRNLNKHAIQ
jgi:hypothetical protein